MSANQKMDGMGDRFYSDKGFEWRPGRLYIPASSFSGIAYEATTGNAIKSIGTGTPDATNLAVNEVNTSGITGMLLKTADNSVNHLMEVPFDMDFAKPIYAHVYWTASDASGSADWEMFYKVFVPGTTILGSAEAATAMSTVGAAQTTGGAYVLNRTPALVIAANAIAESTELLQLKVQMHALVTITLPFFIGLALRYSPRRLRGPDGMSKEAKAPIAIAAKQYN